MLITLRLSMFLRRARGNATSSANTSNKTARRTLGDYRELKTTTQCEQTIVPPIQLQLWAGI